MKARSARVAGAVGLVCLAGCANIDVYRPAPNKDDTKATKRIGGIPFYVKVPQWSQTTTRVSHELHVTVTLKRQVDGGKDETVTWPAGGAMRLQDTAATRADIDRALGALMQARDAWPDLAAAFKAVNDALLPVLATAPTPAAEPTDNQAPVVSNAWAMSMVVGQEQYQVAGRQPLFGTSETKFTFNPDGTLTNADQKTTDDTAKTLLGLFPIADKLRLRWGITAKEEAAPEGGKVAASATKGKPRPEESVPKRATPKPILVEATLTELKRFFMLKKILSGEPGQTQPLGPLSLAAARQGIDRIELVETTIQGRDKEPPAEPSADGAYLIQGKVVPPKAPEQPKAPGVDGANKK